MTDVVFGATFRGHVAQIDLLVHDLDLRRRQAENWF